MSQFSVLFTVPKILCMKESTESNAGISLSIPVAGHRLIRASRPGDIPKDKR